MERIKLFENINLNYIPSDKFKTDYISISFIIPLKKETASLCSLLPMVLKRGCEKYPTMSLLNKRLSYMYATSLTASSGKVGEMQVLTISGNFLSKSIIPENQSLIDDVSAILYELINRPLIKDNAFDKDYVAGEKANLKDEIKAQINNKTTYANQKCISEMCKNEAYGIDVLGSEQDVDSISSHSLYSFYNKLLSQSRIEVFYNGCENKDTIKKAIIPIFENIERTETQKCHTVVIPKPDKQKEITEEMDVKQGKLAIGFRTPYSLNGGNICAVSVFNEIFGGSPMSKLFLNVREKLSLCYYCRSLFKAHKGILLVASGIEVENKDKALKEILLQLDNMKNGIISQQEMQNAKRSLTNSYKEISDSASGICSWHLSRILGDDYSSPSDFIKELENVTTQDIIDVANNILLDTVFFLKGTQQEEK